MKNFFKTLLASFLGFFLGLCVLFFMLFVIASAIFMSSTKPVVPKEKTVLYLHLPYQIEERTAEPFDNFSLRNLKPERQLGLHDIVKNINKAKDDARIVGIYLHVDLIQAGYASLKEIRNALEDFKESGKFVVSHSEMLILRSYYLASVADNVFITPTGIFQFNGILAQTTYFKDLLEKLDIDMQVITGPDHHYKSAVERFSLNKMSNFHQEQLTYLIDDLWDELSGDIAHSRKRTKQEVDQLASKGILQTTEPLIDMGFVDGFLYKDEVIKLMKDKAGIPGEQALNLISIERYDLVEQSIPKNAKIKKDKIAIVYASGEMLLGKNRDGNMGSETLSKTIREIREDSSIVAMVLRINSGGGSALAAEIMWREIMLCQQVKPVVVSMGDYAASGAYYIAAPADVIVANPYSITGSIGVYGMLPNMQGFFNNKLGITFDQVKNFPYADMLSPVRALTPNEIALFDTFIANTYTLFKDRVAAGRMLPEVAVEKAARGRIWSAKEAINHQLADTVGMLSDAVLVAAELANTSDYSLIERPIKPDMLESFMKGISQSVLKKDVPKMLLEQVYQFPVLQHMKNQDYILSRMPFELSIH